MGRGPIVRVRGIRGDDPHAERREALAAVTPFLGLVRAPLYPSAPSPAGQGTGGRDLQRPPLDRRRGQQSRRPDPERASFVISELGADVLALQEVVRPFAGEDPLIRLADQLRLHVAFVTTRIHRLGELGNAILSRWPIVERVAARSQLLAHRAPHGGRGAARLRRRGRLSLVATHLAIVDRTRHRQVRHLLDHPHLQGPVILLGDMNMWRTNDKATKALEAELPTHSEIDWPASFPAARPVLALDRIYARGAKVLEVRAHQSPAAKTRLRPPPRRRPRLAPLTSPNSPNTPAKPRDPVPA